jgi:CMP/dCMP kinase
MAPQRRYEPPVSSRPPIVALDGPAGAGKSTVARRLAQSLGFLLIDTGAMYRAIAIAAEEAEIPWTDDVRVSELAKRVVDEGSLRLGTGSRGQPAVHVFGRDVTDAIRTPEASRGASVVSAIPGVRDALLRLQRKLGEAGGVVMEGRDIGTIVFPLAEAKFFVTASPEVRARRRFDELSQKGVETTFEETLHEVVTRDEADRTRPIAPLIPASDAELIDTSSMPIDDVVAAIEAAVKSRFPT